jgi:thioredoxin-related protein
MFADKGQDRRRSGTGSGLGRRRLDRRAVLAGAAAMALAWRGARAEAVLGEDGLYHMDWYLESFLELTEDLKAASAAGKRFAILWGLRGCSLCRRMHEVHLAQPSIAAYVRSNFDILHLNILGDREVTDFDGSRVGEKAFAQRYGVRGTPTIQFFPETIEGLAGKTAAEREVARMKGLPDPAEFLAMFRYVREKAYEAAPVERWLPRAG